MSRSKKPSTDQKIAALQLCEADSYLPTIIGCLTEEQQKLLRPHHMANFMALSAELFLSNYDSIGTAFERNNGLEISFKAKLAQEKDNVEISFKPVDVFKDSASANLPDENQETFEFVKPKKSKPATEKVVDAEVLSLPAPAVEVLALPVPSERTPEEEDAFNAGASAFRTGKSDTTNPHTYHTDLRIGALWHAWREGFDYEASERIKEEGDEAANLGISQSENPYHPASAAYRSWDEGWIWARCYILGNEAAQEGYPVEQCIHDIDSLEGKAWRAGWSDGQSENQKLPPAKEGDSDDSVI